MVTTTFDALHVAREIKAAGVEASQAEAITEGIPQAAIADRAELATKADVASMAALILAMAGKLFGVF